jgi:prenyltransferase beta subunit
MKKFIFFTILFLVLLQRSGFAFPLDTTNSSIQSALQFLNQSQLDDGSFGYLSNTGFAIMALSAANQDPHLWLKNGTNAIDYIKNVIIPSFNSSLNASSHYSVTILALIAANENPENISGKNLTQELLLKQNSDGSFNNSEVPGWYPWITDDIWPVLTLTSLGYKYSIEVNKTVEYLKSKQLDDGGYGGCYGGICSSGSDETSLAIMALMSASEGNDSSVILNASSNLRTFQNYDGGFNSSHNWGNSNVDSDSWAIQAIAAMGNDIMNWTKNNTTPVDHLLTLQDETDGHFKFDNFGTPPFSPIIDVSYAIMALLGKPFSIKGSFAVCGNSVCDTGESCSSCQQDCGICPTTTISIEPTTTVIEHRGGGKIITTTVITQTTIPTTTIQMTTTVFLSTSTTTSTIPINVTNTQSKPSPLTGFVTFIISPVGIGIIVVIIVLVFFVYLMLPER